MKRWLVQVAAAESICLEADAAIDSWGRTGGIRIGGNLFSRFDLRLDALNQQLHLDWTFNPPPELDLAAFERHFETSFPVTWVAFYRPVLEAVDGQVRIALQYPVVWSYEMDWAQEITLLYTSLAALGDMLALTVEDRTYAVSPDGNFTESSLLESWASETRVWQLEGDRGQRIGVCMPEASKVVWGIVPSGRESRWASFVSKNLGPFLGQSAGYLAYPLSLAAGPDGRMYILDAGNARVVVLDSEGKHVTQWGTLGDGEGQFNFGNGLKRLQGQNYSGSICVDDDGFIYVADVGNQRLQKFAP